MDNMKSIIKHNACIEKHQLKPWRTQLQLPNEEQLPPTRKLSHWEPYLSSHSDNTRRNYAKKYIGMTASIFKTRYNNHTKSFRDVKYSKETALSNYIWNLKKGKCNYEIKWSILKHTKSYNSGSKRCNLCVKEKMCIMKVDPTNLLNKKTKIFSKCRHRTKHCLCNLTRSATTHWRQRIPFPWRNYPHKRTVIADFPSFVWRSPKRRETISNNEQPFSYQHIPLYVKILSTLEIVDITTTLLYIHTYIYTWTFWFTKYKEGSISHR